MKHIRSVREAIASLLLLVFLALMQQTTAYSIGVCREVTCPCTKEQLKEGMTDTPKGCRKKCEATKAWEDYKRNLKIVHGLWEDAEEDSERALEEFDEAGKEILSELGFILPKEGGAKAAEVTVAHIAEHSLEKTAASKVLLQDVGGTVGADVALGAGVVVPLAEVGAAFYNLNVATNNLNYATQSQAKMYARADEKWKQVLADLERAKAQEKACEDENKALDEKVKAEQELEKSARRYMEQGGLITPDGRVIDVYYVGNKEFRDANEALEAAKQLVIRRRQSGSGSGEPRSFVHHVTSGPIRLIAEQYTMTADEAKETIRLIRLAEQHIQLGATLTVKQLKDFRMTRERLHSILSQMGTS